MHAHVCRNYPHTTKEVPGSLRGSETHMAKTHVEAACFIRRHVATSEPQLLFLVPLLHAECAQERGREKASERASEREREIQR